MTEYVFGELLRMYRKRAGLSQLDLADQIKRGRTTISNWERSNNLPEGRETVIAVANTLNLSPAEANELLQAAEFSPVEIQPEEHKKTGIPRPGKDNEGDRERFVSYPKIWLPSHYIERTHEEVLRHALLDSKRYAYSNIIILQGGGGFGKTTLARSVCQSVNVREKFPDGVLWMEIGQDPNLPELLADQISLLTNRVARFTTRDAALTLFAKLVADKRMLLILDDVWQESHIEPFLQIIPNGKVLVTTRRTDLSIRLEAVSIEINRMSFEESLQLLTGWMGHEGIDLSNFEAFSVKLFGWPLLIELARSYLRDLVINDKMEPLDALHLMEERLIAKGGLAFDEIQEGERNKSIAISIETSVERLGDWQERYFELAIFPQGVNIPVTVIARLWGMSGDLDMMDTQDALKIMRRLHLLDAYDFQENTVRLHNVIYDYLKNRATNLLNIHGKLIDAYDGQPWARTILDEPYFFNNLFHHLLGSGSFEKILSLGLDFDYIVAKIYKRGCFTAEKDLKTIQRVIEFIKTNHPKIFTQIFTFGDNAGFPKKVELLNRVLSRSSHVLDFSRDSLQDVEQALTIRLADIPLLQSVYYQGVWKCSVSPMFIPKHLLPDQPNPALVRLIGGALWQSMYMGEASVSGYGKILAMLTYLGIPSLSGWSSRLELFDYDDGPRLFAREGGIMSYSLNQDASLLTLADRNELEIWDVKKQTLISKIAVQNVSGLITNLAINQDGSKVIFLCDYLLGYSQKKRLCLWEPDRIDMGKSISVLEKRVIGCSMSSDARVIAFVREDGDLVIWNKDRDNTITVKSNYTAIKKCVLNCDGTYVAVVPEYGGTITVWNANDGTKVHEEVNNFAVKDCALGANSACFVFGESFGSGFSMTVWDFNLRKAKIEIGGYASSRVPSSCSISDDGRKVVTTSPSGVSLWDSSIEVHATNYYAHTKDVKGCVISSDGESVVTVADDGLVKVWDWEGGSPNLTLKHGPELKGCAISHDKSIIVSISHTYYDHEPKVWDLNTGEELCTFLGHSGGGYDCAISPDGKIIYTASRQVVKAWNAYSGEELFSLEHEIDPFYAPPYVSCCVLSGNGQYLITAAYDGLIRMWDANTGKKLHVLTGHEEAIDCCAVNNDGSIIASGNYANRGDHTLRLWKADNDYNSRIIAKDNRITDIAMTLDGSLIITTSFDGYVRVWNTSSGERLCQFAAAGKLWSCDCSPDGKKIVVGGEYGVYFLQLALPDIE